MPILRRFPDGHHFFRDVVNLIGAQLFAFLGEPDQQRQIANAVDLSGITVRLSGKSGRSPRV